MRIGIGSYSYGWEAGTYGSDLAGMVEQVGSPCLGVCFDPVNSLGRGEGIREVADLLMPHTVNLHLKDFTVIRGSTDMGFTIIGVPQGEGRLDSEWLLRFAMKKDPEMSVILEQWTPYTGDVHGTIELQNTWAEKGIRSINQLLIRLQES